MTPKDVRLCHSIPGPLRTGVPWCLNNSVAVHSSSLRQSGKERTMEFD